VHDPLYPPSSHGLVIQITVDGHKPDVSNLLSAHAGELRKYPQAEEPIRDSPIFPRLCLVASEAFLKRSGVPVRVASQEQFGSLRS
jgi:hypothetical protein